MRLLLAKPHKILGVTDIKHLQIQDDVCFGKYELWQSHFHMIFGEYLVDLVTISVTVLKHSNNKSIMVLKTTSPTLLLRTSSGISICWDTISSVESGSKWKTLAVKSVDYIDYMGDREIVFGKTRYSWNHLTMMQQKWQRRRSQNYLRG